MYGDMESKENEVKQRGPVSSASASASASSAST